MNAWKASAWHALYELAQSGEPFTSDDLLERVGPPDDQHTPNAKNSTIGSMFREAAAAGIIASDGRVVQSKAPYRKGGAVRVWVGVPGPTLFDTP